MTHDPHAHADDSRDVRVNITDHRGQSMSSLEMAIVAAQARASLGRIEEFTDFPVADKQALDRVHIILANIVDQVDQNIIFP